METRGLENRLNENSTEAPTWFKQYIEKVRSEFIDPLDEVKKLSTMSYDQVRSHIGGDLSELPYDFLQTLFVDGTDDENVAVVLRKKRTAYLKEHPEKRVSSGATEGIITFDGRFIPISTWNSASDSEKRGALVGSTCFHFNSDTPGMGSSPEDRF